MFGGLPDFSKLGELIPKMNEFADKIAALAQQMVDNQKRHEEILRRIAEKTGVEIGDIPNE